MSSPRPEWSAETYSRTAKILADNGEADNLDHAHRLLGQETIRVLVGAGIIGSPGAQAALPSVELSSTSGARRRAPSSRPGSAESASRTR